MTEIIKQESVATCKCGHKYVINDMFKGCICGDRNPISIDVTEVIVGTDDWMEQNFICGGNNEME